MLDFQEYTEENSTGETKELLAKIRGTYGFIPSLFNYMAEAPTTLQAYLSLNELLAKTSIPMAQLQVALLAASLENNCNFCSVAHRAIGKKMGANVDSLDALNEGLEIKDVKDKAIADFTLSIIRNRGQVPSEDVEKFLAAGFGQQQIFEVILVVTIKTLSNYSNQFTKPKPNPELLAML